MAAVKTNPQMERGSGGGKDEQPRQYERLRVLFGIRLRTLRRQHRLTQGELGNRSDVSSKLVGQIERGTGNPTLRVIIGFAQALEVDPAALLQFEEEAGPA
jgi:transcriptional regulator with XRE-family HTH domain